MIYDLIELINYSKEHSPFYNELYKDLPSKITNLSDVPLIDQINFWRALKESRLFTSDINDCIVFKSGGTTGSPKISVYTVEEWRSFVSAFGWGISKGVLKNADKVGNLFYAGDLYSSFLFIKDSLENCPVNNIQYPISGNIPLKDIIKFLLDYKINVIAGVPSNIINMAEYIDLHNIKGFQVNKILYGGEGVYKDQCDYLTKVFNGASIHSIGYASVDGGLVGYADTSCCYGEHRVFGDKTIIEIIDEHSGKIITKENIDGKIYLTNLTRKLMPIIRYPVGDRAFWCEPENIKDRKFKLLGRSEEAARIGPVSLYYEDIRQVLNGLNIKFSGFQFIVSHFNKKDKITLKIAVNLDQSKQIPMIKDRIYKSRPMLKDHIDKNSIHPLDVIFCKTGELQFNPRTGKLIKIIYS